MPSRCLSAAVILWVERGRLARVDDLAPHRDEIIAALVAEPVSPAAEPAGVKSRAP